MLIEFNNYFPLHSCIQKIKINLHAYVIFKNVFTRDWKDVISYMIFKILKEILSTILLAIKNTLPNILSKHFNTLIHFLLEYMK